MSYNETDEDLLRTIHQDIQQLLEKRFLNSLDTSLAVLVPIVAVLLAILRFYEFLTDPRILNLTMVGVFLSLIVPILLNIVSIISNNLILRVCSWSSLSIIFTNWLFLTIFELMFGRVRFTEILAFKVIGFTVWLSFGIFLISFNSVITTKLISSICSQIPSRRTEMEKFLYPPWNRYIVFFHGFIVWLVFVVFTFAV